VTFTDNWANDLIGATAAATATPKDGLLERTQDQKAADVGEQPTGKKTSLLADYGAPVGAESFREWLNDLNANQPGFMGPKSPAVPETTVNAPSELEVVRSGDVQGGIAVGRKLDQLARTNPEALKSLHRELQSYQKGYSAKLHSNYMEKKAPKPSSPNYASEKRKYDKWVERREQEAQLEGLKKAGNHWNNKAFVRAPTETTVNLASGVRSLGGNPLHNNTQIGINNRLKALDIPKGYRNLPGIQVSQGLGEGLAFAGGLPAAPFEAAGRVSRTLALEGVAKKSQIAHAYGHAALNLAPGLATKVNAAVVRAYMKVKKSNLLDPVYDNAIMLGETVGDALSALAWTGRWGSVVKQKEKIRRNKCLSKVIARSDVFVKNNDPNEITNDVSGAQIRDIFLISHPPQINHGKLAAMMSGHVHPPAVLFAIGFVLICQIEHGTNDAVFGGQGAPIEH